MAEATGISWCDSTFNPWLGCSETGPGCDCCYARPLVTNRLGHGWGDDAPRVRTSAGYWAQAARWNADGVNFQQAHGRMRRVFSASLADIFDKHAPEHWREEFFVRIVRPNQWLQWFILTKRSSNVLRYLPADWREANYSNVVLIFTACNQEELDRDGPRLLMIKARYPWLRIGLSIEPMLGPISLDRMHKGICPMCAGTGEWRLDRCANCGGIGRDVSNLGLDVVICGGESKQHGQLRELVPFELEWARSLRDQCRNMAVPFHFKQWGHTIPVSQTSPAYPLAIPVEHHLVYPTGYRVILKEGMGRLLDGIEHNGFPSQPTR